MRERTQGVKNREDVSPIGAATMCNMGLIQGIRHMYISRIANKYARSDDV